MNGPDASPNQSAAPAPDDVALDTTVDIDSLYSLRAAVAAHATDLGMSEDRLSKLLVVANELATNAIRYANGSARLRLWRQGDDIYCQISDDGPGIGDPDAAGTREVPLNATGGRGLWIVRRLSDRVEIANGSAGASVTAIVKII